jgi:hypothetical protein
LQIYQQENDADDQAISEGDQGHLMDIGSEENREYGEPPEWGQGQSNGYGNYLENNLLDSGNTNSQNFMIEENPVYQNYIEGIDGIVDHDFEPLKPFSNEKIRGVDASLNSQDVTRTFGQQGAQPVQRSRQNFGGGSKGLQPIVNKDDEFDRMGKKLGTYSNWTKDKVRAMLPDNNPNYTFKIAGGQAPNSNNRRHSPNLGVTSNNNRGSERGGSKNVSSQPMGGTPNPGGKSRGSVSQKQIKRKVSDRNLSQKGKLGSANKGNSIKDLMVNGSKRMPGKTGPKRQNFGQKPAQNFEQISENQISEIEATSLMMKQKLRHFQGARPYGAGQTANFGMSDSLQQGRQHTETSGRSIPMHQKPPKKNSNANYEPGDPIIVQKSLKDFVNQNGRGNMVNSQSTIKTNAKSYTYYNTSNTNGKGNSIDNAQMSISENHSKIDTPKIPTGPGSYQPYNYNESQIQDHNLYSEITQS